MADDGEVDVEANKDHPRVTAPLRDGQHGSQDKLVQRERHVRQHHQHIHQGQRRQNRIRRRHHGLLRQHRNVNHIRHNPEDANNNRQVAVDGKVRAIKGHEIVPTKGQRRRGPITPFAAVQPVQEEVPVGRRGPTDRQTRHEGTAAQQSLIDQRHHLLRVPIDTGRRVAPVPAMPHARLEKFGQKFLVLLLDDWQPVHGASGFRIPAFIPWWDHPSMETRTRTIFSLSFPSLPYQYGIVCWRNFLPCFFISPFYAWSLR